MANTKGCITLLVLLLGLAQGKIYKTRFDQTTWDDYNWRLTTEKCQQGRYQARSSLANGYVGINLAALGPFFEVDVPVKGDMIGGWPLFDRRQTFATVAGFWDSQPYTNGPFDNGTNFPWMYQYGGESVIAGIPHWSGLIPNCKGQYLDASTNLNQISDFSSTFDYRAGTVAWSYTWTPPNCPALKIEYDMLVHKLHVNQAAVSLKITPSSDADIKIYDVLDGNCAQRTKFVGKGSEEDSATIWSAVSPHGVPDVEAYVYSTMVGDATVDLDSLKRLSGGPVEGHNASSIAQSVTAHLKAGRITRIRKYVGIASSDAIKNPKQVAKQASLEACQAGYLNMLHSHMDEWLEVVPANSVDSYRDPTTGNLPNDENIVELQILAITNLYYMLQNTVGTNAMEEANNMDLNKYSLSVGGLTSDAYAGMVFWDADVWMQPGLVLSHPEATRQISEYRLDRRQQAIANVKTAYQSSQNKTAFSPDSAVYSWTSGRYGNCTASGPCFDYEYHLNGDIALQVENYYSATGDIDKWQKDYFPMFMSAAQLYSDLLYLNKTTGTYMIRNATDPDEFANHVTNPGYTMILAQTILKRAVEYQKQLNLTPNKEWLKKANNIEIPVDNKAGLHLEYSQMPGYIDVKQADVVLIYDFLHYQSKFQQNDLDYYAGRQSQAGPAMTYGVFSIVAAETYPSGCSSYTYDLYGTQPYVRGPWFQFSEQLLDDFEINGGFHPAFPFLTGMGGANRVAPYGYLGLRLKSDVLNVNPNLPPQIPNLRLRTIYWKGHALSATLNGTHTTITRLNKRLSTADPFYTRHAIPVTIGQSSTPHSLAPGGTLTLKTRRPDHKQTVPGNVGQCKTVTSDAAFRPGQFPLAAVDGAIATKWQPEDAAEPASITVDLGNEGFVPIQGFSFDWAQAVPKEFSITFANLSDPSPGEIVKVASSKNVKVSKPYDPKSIAEVRPYMSNTTDVELPKAVWGGRYATLTIKGSHANKGGNGPGATVAEWAIIMQGGRKLKRNLRSVE